MIHSCAVRLHDCVEHGKQMWAVLTRPTVALGVYLELPRVRLGNQGSEGQRRLNTQLGKVGAGWVRTRVLGSLASIAHSCVEQGLKDQDRRYVSGAVCTDCPIHLIVTLMS